MARRRSRDGDRPRSARARVGPAGAPGRSRRRRPARVRARHLRDAARVRAAHAVDLQRPRLHPARRFSRRIAAARRSRSSSSGSTVRPEPDVLTFDARRRRSTALAAPTRPMDEDARRGRTADRRGARQLRGGARRRRRATPACSARRRRSARFARAMLRAARGDARSPRAVHAGAGRDVHDEERRARQLARARAGIRCCRLRRAARGCRRAAFGHVGFTGTSLWIDPGARSVFRAADQPRLRRRHARRDARRCAARFTMRSVTCNRGDRARSPSKRSSQRSLRPRGFCL